MPSLKIEHLKKITLFTELTVEELHFLQQYLVKKRFKPGELILQQGAYGDELYFIQSGIVSVRVILPGDEKKETFKLSKGQILGEVALLVNDPITATIVADTSCNCVVLPRKVLTMLRIACPEMAYKIEKGIAELSALKVIINLEHTKALIALYHDESQHIQHFINLAAHRIPLKITQLSYDFTATFPFFSSLSKKELKKVVGYFNLTLYEKGYRFLTGDEVENSLCIIYSGAVMLFVKENNELKKPISVLQVGELFMPNFYKPELREIASYVACERCIVMEINKKNYYKLRDLHPSFFYILSQYLHRTVAGALYTYNRQFIRLNSEYYGVS